MTSRTSVIRPVCRHTISWCHLSHWPSFSQLLHVSIPWGSPTHPLHVSYVSVHVSCTSPPARQCFGTDLLIAWWLELGPHFENIIQPLQHRWYVLVTRHRDLGMHPEACYRGMCGCAGHARYAPKQTSCLTFIRTSVSHNSLKSSPISLILLYLSSSRQCQDAHTICGEIFWLFCMAISYRTKQLSIHNLFISTCNYIK